MAPLTNIGARLTPSAPIEITFGQQPIQTGVKFATLFGHMAASPGIGTPYQVYEVQNFGNAAAALLEVENLAGVGAQIAEMAAAFINANALSGGSNFPNFRVVLIPNSVSNFGPNIEAITAVTNLRSDMLVSCYPAGDSSNYAILNNFAIQISGPDGDLVSQFGSFGVYGSIDSLAVAEAYDLNSKFAIVAFMPDSNTAAVSGVTGTTVIGSQVISSVAAAPISISGTLTSGETSVTGITSTAGIYPGAQITGTGIPSNTTVEQVLSTSLIISNMATASGAESLSVQNVPATAGIYPGAEISGTGIPGGSVVVSVTASSITINQAATAAGSSVALTIQNVISQNPEILACAQAAVMMASAFPYNPLQGVVAGGILPPAKQSDWIVVSAAGSSETALQSGLSPMYVQPGNTVALLRTRTTWTMNGLIPVTAYFDWQDLVTLNDFREDVFEISQNPPFNNNPGGTKDSQFVANLFKDEVIRLAKQFEDEGAFQAVSSLAPQFIVQNSTLQRGRFDFQIPVNVLPGLYVIAGNIQAVTTFDFTL